MNESRISVEVANLQKKLTTPEKQIEALLDALAGILDRKTSISCIPEKPDGIRLDLEYAEYDRAWIVFLAIEKQRGFLRTKE